MASFVCCMCGENISEYRVDIHRIEDNEIVATRDYCKECAKKLFGENKNGCTST